MTARAEDPGNASQGRTARCLAPREVPRRRRISLGGIVDIARAKRPKDLLSDVLTGASRENVGLLQMCIWLDSCQWFAFSSAT